MPGFMSVVATMVWKDLRIEFRSREILYTMAFFGAMVVLLFSFAFDPEDAANKYRAAGMIWVSVVFAGTLGLSRAFDRERDGDTMRALLLSPAPRAAIFVSKAISTAVFIALVEVVVVGMAGLLFAAPIGNAPLLLAASLLLGTLGVSVVGSAFAAMLLRVPSRDVLLPVVLYPILVPLFMAAAFSTTALLLPSPEIGVAGFWIKFMVVYDAVFAVAALWIFESVIIE